MRTYPAAIIPDGSSYTVSFPDVPEALTCGDTLEEAIEMAHDALATAMEFYDERGEPRPEPSALQPGHYPIKLPPPGGAQMSEALFGGLVESMTEMGEIVRGERAPSREVQGESQVLRAKKPPATSG